MGSWVSSTWSHSEAASTCDGSNFLEVSEADLAGSPGPKGVADVGYKIVDGAGESPLAPLPTGSTGLWVSWARPVHRLQPNRLRCRDLSRPMAGNSVGWDRVGRSCMTRKWGAQPPTSPRKAGTACYIAAE